jgi:bifunctional non-homologous end joining protein LigD
LGPGNNAAGERRSGAWVKVKLTRSQEFVIGGYTMHEGSRKYFGSLLAGYNSPDGLRFAGRVGIGFSENLLASVDAQFQKTQTNRLVLLSICRRKRVGVGD